MGGIVIIIVLLLLNWVVTISNSYSTDERLGKIEKLLEERKKR